MGFCEFLTLVFITLKLAGIITWSWPIVFLPMLPAVLLYIIIITVIIKSTWGL